MKVVGLLDSPSVFPAAFKTLRQWLIISYKIETYPPLPPLQRFLRIASSQENLRRRSTEPRWGWETAAATAAAARHFALTIKKARGIMSSSGFHLGLGYLMRLIPAPARLAARCRLTGTIKP